MNIDNYWTVDGSLKIRSKREDIICFLKEQFRRMPDRLDLKGRLPDYLIEIVMAVDVSGSVSDQAIAYTLGEGYHLSRELNAPFTVLQIDTEVQQENTIKRPSDLEELDIKGRGGTLFQPAFDYLYEKGSTNKDTLLVYVTDGHGEPEDQINRYGFNNVLWVLVDTNTEESLSCEGNGRVKLLNNDSSYSQ